MIITRSDSSLLTVHQDHNEDYNLIQDPRTRVHQSNWPEIQNQIVKSNSSQFHWPSDCKECHDFHVNPCWQCWGGWGYWIWPRDWSDWCPVTWWWWWWGVVSPDSCLWLPDSGQCGSSLLICCTTDCTAGPEAAPHHWQTMGLGPLPRPEQRQMSTHTTLNTVQL